MNIDNAHFSFCKIDLPYSCISTYLVWFKSEYIPDTKKCDCAVRKAYGRVVIIDDPSAFELRLYPFYELIHRSWRPGTRNFVRENPNINLGTSVRQFIYEKGGYELMDIAGRRGNRIRNEVLHCVFACNTLQTGFVRGNGFIIAPPLPGLDYPSTLICKPFDAPGRYDPIFIPLGPPPDSIIDSKFDGKYDTFVITPTPEVIKLEVHKNFKPNKEKISLAFSSPAIIRKNLCCYDEIKYYENPGDANDPATGRGTVGNEVNWDQEIEGTSFTAFGLRGHKIFIASMLQELPGKKCGILAGEMAILLKKHFGVTDAVIGGGSGDTQQFLSGNDNNELLVAEARTKTADEKAAPEVLGDRGLGAIFAILKKSQNTKNGTNKPL